MRRNCVACYATILTFYKDLTFRKCYVKTTVEATYYYLTKLNIINVFSAKGEPNPHYSSTVEKESLARQIVDAVLEF